MKSITLLALFLLSMNAVVCSNTTQTLSIKANDEVTVSGVSSGGFMSAQMLVAYSNDIKGAGLFASGPYFCTRGVAATIVDCMTTGLSIYTEQLILAAEGFEALGLVDKLSNIQNSRVYLFSGKNDYIVWQGVVKKNEEFFRKLGANIQTEFDLEAEHCFPTDFFGNECGKLGSPYINNCGYKGSKNSLEHIMGTTLLTKVDYKTENLLSFDQSKYNPGMSSSFADSGMIYVPDGCKEKACPLHVAFHGCSQTVKDIGLDYVYGTGFLGIAEANDIIILYPQVKISSIYPYNPKGCWDWWGYSEVIPSPVQWSYPTKDGTQMKAVYSMIKDIQSGAFQLDKVFAFRDVPLSSY